MNALFLMIVYYGSTGYVEVFPAPSRQVCEYWATQTAPGVVAVCKEGYASVDLNARTVK